MRKYFSQQCGIAIFEQTLGVLLFVMLSVGIYDLARIIHVKNSLNHAVQVALRCLFPEQAECLQALEPNNEPLFEVYEDPTIGKFVENYYRYSGQASWMIAPNVEFSKPVAKVLDQVNYDVTQKYFVHNKELKQRRGIYSYYTKIAQSPFALTNGNPKSPSFVHKPNHSRVYDYATISTANPRSISNIAGSTTGESSIGSISFVVPRLKNISCFESERMDIAGPQRVHSPDFSKKCDANFADLVFHITGKVPLRNNSIGQVFIKISQDGVVNRELGGLKFWQTAGQSGNFVPRGLPSGYYDSHHGYPEFYIHSPIRVERGKTVSISFRIKKFSGPESELVSWQGGEIKIFTEQYNVTEKLDLPCANLSGKCAAILPETGKIIPDIALVKDYIESNIEVKNLGCLPELVDQQTLLKQVDSNCTACFISINNAVSCNLLQRSEKCPSNFGIAAESNEAILEQKKLICPPNYLKPLNISWRDKNINLEDYRITRQVESCSDYQNPTKNELPAYLSQYADLHWGEKKYLDYNIIDTKGIRPQILKENDSKYQCIQFKIEQKQFGGDIAQDESFFAAAYSETELGCDWKNKLKIAATSEGGPPGAHFEFLRTLDSTVESIEPVGVCEESDSTIFSSNYFYVGAFPLAKAEEYCERSNFKCFWRVLSKPFKQAAALDPNYDLAYWKYGFQSFQAQVPKALYNCEGSNCTKFLASDLGDRVKVEANFKMRFFSLPFKSLLISSAAENYWEK